MPRALAAFGLLLAAQGCGTRWSDPAPHTTFPLVGAHASARCEACHTSAATPPVACEACHEAERPLPHWAGSCDTCHDEAGWGTFVHDVFALQDAHAVDCLTCHVGGTLDLDPACTSCHESDRPTGHFMGQDCGSCHVPTAWGTVVVDHSFFPLQGVHDQLCTTCHTGGDYTGLSAACASCHEADRPAGHFVGQECGACHPATDWAAGTFDHTDLFPLPHRGISACDDCHLGGDTTDFSCTHCHEHRQTEANAEHLEVNGYVWESHACFDCHPDGRHE